MQNWERAVTRTSHMSRLYLGYCLENELNQKHNFVLNTVCFYWLPVALRCHFRWRHISSIECGGSGSSFGGVCIHSRLNSTKNNLISSVFYCLPVILLQMRGVWGALLSVRACALALWGHVSQWMQGTWGAVWVFAHAPRNPFKWLHRTWEQLGGLCMRSRSMGHVTKWRQNMQFRSGGQLKQ